MASDLVIIQDVKRELLMSHGIAFFLSNLALTLVSYNRALRKNNINP
jgi:hypothetical protein